MRARLGFTAILLAASVLLSAAPGQQAQSAQQTSPPTPQGAAPDQQTTFRARIDSVSVDASVTDKLGHQVTDLKPADFEIRENNKPQTIDTFKYVAIDDSPVDAATVPEVLSMADQERETANDSERLIVIFLDDYHTHLTASMRIRQPLANWVRSLNPHTLVALVTPLMPVTLITFSHDMEGIASQIMSFVGRKYDYIPKYPIEQNLAFLDPTQVEQIRNTVVISELEGVCAYLGTLRDGRKTLIYVSEGLTGDVQNATIMSAGQGFGSAGTGSTVSQALLSDFNDIFAAASKSNTSIYTMDPRGLAATAMEVGDPGATHMSTTQDRQILNDQLDTLHEIADNTGGRPILGLNDPRSQLQQLLSDTSGYYLMSYTSTEKPRDGKFHQISVKVLRKDLQVRARKGYYAYSAEEVAKATAPPKPRPPAAVTEALDAVEEPRTDHPFHVWAGATRGADGKALLTLSWEVASVLGAGPKTETIDHVSLNARSQSGDQVYDGDLKADPAAPTTSGTVSFAVPPGAVRLKVTALSASGDRIDVIDRDVDVPDFTAVGALITTPEIYSAFSAREMQKVRAAKVPMPTPVRTFDRTETLLFRFQAYGPAGTTPKVTMRLLNQLGQPMVDLPAPTQVGPTGFEAQVGLGNLAPGSYVFEIDADSGASKAQQLVAINVTS